MIKKILVTEHDGMNTRNFVINCEVPNETFDLKAAVFAASTEYCKTDVGRRNWKYNCHCFNWADFESLVPNEICEKHGFKKIDSDSVAMEVDWDETVVYESELEDEDE